MLKKILSMSACVAVMMTGTSFAQLSAAKDVSNSTLAQAANSQRKIDNISEEISKMVAEYRASLKQLESSQKYNRSLSRQTELQKNQIERLRQDIEALSGIQEAMLPHMEDMLTRLVQLVDSDIPFNLEERQARIERLNGLVDNPSQSEAQKYRLILEAYQIELEYGRTIGAYVGSVEDEGQKYEGVEFYRVGRLLLVYKTSDDQRLRVWSSESKAWEDLDKKFLPDIKLGLRMAKELTPPDLLLVPLKKTAN